jgi:nucleoside-diphosphate-sugar epimerase
MGGRQRLPYTFVGNCADAIVQATFAAGIDGEAFNIVDDELPTGNQVLRRYRRTVGSLRRVRVPAAAIAPMSHVYHWYSRRSNGQLPPALTAYRSGASWKRLRYSNVKARRTLGWAPQVPLTEALDRTLTAWKARTA